MRSNFKPLGVGVAEFLSLVYSQYSFVQLLSPKQTHQLQVFIDITPCTET